MDYRYYRGDGPKLPKKITKHIHKLRYIGTGMILVGVIIPWLVVIKILESTFWINFLSMGLWTVGTISVIIGVVFDNMIDRAE